VSRVGVFLLLYTLVICLTQKPGLERVLSVISVSALVSVIFSYCFSHLTFQLLFYLFIFKLLRTHDKT